MCRMAKAGRLSNSGLPEYDRGLDMNLAYFNENEKELKASVYFLQSHGSVLTSLSILITHSSAVQVLCLQE